MEDHLSPEETADYELDQLACSIAEAFIDAYYLALEKDRDNIASFYCPKFVSPDGTVPFIAWNGTVYDNGDAFQEFYEGLTHTHYDVEALDCTVLNRKAIPAAAVQGGSGDDSRDFDRRMSVQISASGSVRLKEPLKGPIRVFSDVFVLVPNSEKLPSPKPTFEKGWQKQWVIQTQSFRFTEWSPDEIAGAKVDEAKTTSEGKKELKGRGRGIANQFAAAGIFAKGRKMDTT
ncbi:uncharacterized protein EI97DRAFT_18650 [Westerdykella ornata]|uniref:NTF2 domain-containing protein n=1 Tax=Westerdykella ornata TaxID=318751 RepID=A0A6A6JXS8_WESOR|nr:uncharacterized protein EI97DRAFT_18650 [Westerdykella ornata]KAF2281025.1 hypothetical protein EI97DRAFT_18650 [Westerdykella ornata]